MKNLLFILIFTPIICLSQDISVKTKVGYLNVRNLPHVDSRILGKLENKTRLIYSDTLVDGWIKIKCNGSKEIIEGWVSVGDLYAPNFKSNILQPISESEFFSWKNRKELNIGSSSDSYKTAEGNLLIHYYINPNVDVRRCITNGGKANANSASQANAISVGVKNSGLTNITILDDSVISAFTMSGTAAVVTLTTAGAIRDFTAYNAAALSSLNFGHSHIQGTGSDAATIVVSGTGITALDMSSMNKVKTITIGSNSVLTALTAPNPTDEQGFAEPSAAIAITVSNNLLPGVYTPAVDGTEVTDHVNASLTSAAVSSFKTYIDKFKDASVSGGNVRATTAANIGAGTYINGVTFSIGLDNVDNSSTAGTETVTLASLLTADTDARDGADDNNGVDADGNNLGKKVVLGDIIAYHNSTTVDWLGFFGQASFTA